MKKCLLTLALAVLAFSLFAAYQYEIQPDGIKVNENMSLTIHVTDNSFFKHYDKFGYTVTNPDGTTRSQSFDIDDAKGKKFDLGDFTTGSKVDFFVEDGKSVYKQLSLTEKNVELTYLNVSNGSINDTFKIHIDGGAYHGPNPPPPAGQPLPGVLAALLLGGGTLGAIVLKRKKAAQAAAAKQD